MSVGSNAPVAPFGTRSSPRVAPPSLGKRIFGAFLRGFFTFYYQYARFLTWLMPRITIEGKKLHIPSRVYKPLENEQRFREYVKPGERVCDLGCGSGVITVFVAPVASEVVALDIGEHAVEATKHNCAALGITNVVVEKSDMFEKASGDFDVICANPPFVEIPMRGEDAQWATSVTYLDRLFVEGGKRLKPGGRIVALYPRSKQKRLEEFAAKEGFVLVATKSVRPKSLKLWLICALYMELLFAAQFHVFERR